MPQSQPKTAHELSPPMAQCHARLLAVAKNGTPEAFSATLAGVLHRAELAIGGAYDAANQAIRKERSATTDVAGTIKAFREYLGVHPHIAMGGHQADTTAHQLAMIALDHQPWNASMPRFPTALRKMWSGGEVQDWMDSNLPPLIGATYAKGFAEGMAQRGVAEPTPGAK